jgi:repressor LexA
MKSYRQAQILAFIGDFHREYGYAPTVREIAAAFGLASPATVQAHLDALEHGGYIRRGNGARTLTLVGGSS